MMPGSYSVVHSLAHRMPDGRSPPDWAGGIAEVLVRGTRFIVEVAFLHRDSRTLVLTDLVEYIGDATPDAPNRLGKPAVRMIDRRSAPV